MNNLLSFGISDDTGINIHLPTELAYINRFDDVRTVYVNGIKEVTLSEENLNETVLSLRNMLSRALSGNLHLHSSIEKLKVGYCWNHWTNALSNEAMEDERDYFERHWLWSTNEIQTWLYNVDNMVFLEISPSYKWHFKDPNESDTFISYETFVAGYKEIAILELEIEIAKHWQTKCNEILDTIAK